MCAEEKILQSRMMGMQQDFNKYKSLKDKIDLLNKEIESKNLENDKLSIELQMIKSHMNSKDNYLVIEQNEMKNKDIKLSNKSKDDLNINECETDNKDELIQLEK